MRISMIRGSRRFLTNRVNLRIPKDRAGEMLPVISWRNLTTWFRRTNDPNPNSAEHAGSTLPLRGRLFLTVTIALFPIALVSILQGMERARIDVENVRDRLTQSSRTRVQ